MQNFVETRRRHSLESAEDYTELVLILTEREGEARVTTIARELGISHVTALRTLRRLARDTFIEPGRGPVRLTPKGLQTALRARKRHTLLVDFLVALGVSRKVAEVDVEGAEHHLSDETLRAVKRALKKLS